MADDRFLLRGAKEISERAGVNWKRFPVYLKRGLPAWQHDGQGPYLALVEDVDRWTREQRDRYLPNCQK